MPTTSSAPLRLARAQAAELAFQCYDFGGPILEAGRWETDSGDGWLRSVTIGIPDEPDALGIRCRFHVTFLTGTDNVDEAGVL